MKTGFKILLCSLFVQTTAALAQDADLCESISTLQPFELIDDQITFRSDMMEIGSISIELCTESGEEFVLPKRTISIDGKSVLIDFKDCLIGKYIISGMRGEDLQIYAVELKTH